MEPVQTHLRIGIQRPDLSNPMLPKRHGVRYPLPYRTQTPHTR